ncbi:MAG: cation:proton antiporter [Candidatus Bathyarchaeota archaeon]|nr:cation:proton antiporter [Candidatus Bathyarchaeota archaeon]
MESEILYRAVVDLCLLLFLAQLSAEVAERFKAPKILGILVAGAVFGPNMVGGILIGGRPLIDFNELIHVFAEIGAVLILFAAGLEMTFIQFRSVGAYSLIIGVADVTFCFLLGFGVTLMLGYGWAVGMIVAGALSSTSIAVSTLTMRELGKMDTTEAKVIINAAVVDDILALTLLTLIITYVRGGSALSPLYVARLAASSLIAWFLILILGVYFIPMLLDRAGGMGAGVLELSAILICFGMAFLVSVFRLSPLVGAFSAGMAVAGSRSREKVRAFVASIERIFAPLFFVVMGAGIDPRAFLTGNSLLLIIVVTLVAVLSKVIGCGVPASYLLGDPRPGLRVGLGMISRGEIGFVIASVGLTTGILTGGVYTTLVAVTCITVVIAPLLLRKSYEAEGFMERLDRLYDRLSKLKREPLLKRLRR